MLNSDYFRRFIKSGNESKRYVDEVFEEKSLIVDKRDVLKRDSKKFHFYIDAFKDKIVLEKRAGVS